MVVRVNFHVAGAKQIDAALRELGAAAAHRVVRSAINKSATVVVRRARELAWIIHEALAGADQAIVIV